MTSNPTSTLAKIALSLTLTTSAWLATLDHAEARPFGKKAGFHRTSGAKLKISKGSRRLSFRHQIAKPRTSVAVARRSIGSPVASASLTASTSMRPRIATTPRATPVETARERRGLLARIFGSSSEREAAAGAWSSSTRGSRGRASTSPRLAPGQPNAVQSAPVINHQLIASSSKSQSRVVINIARQRAYVYIGDRVAVDTPVSTARSGKYTPRGTFRIGERGPQGKISTLYDVEMPYWMRLGSSVYGMHAGYLPGYPASAGCIRMPYSAAQAVYSATGPGTQVRIVGGG